MNGPSDALLHTLVDKVPGVLAYWDTDHRCRFANRAFEEWFGFSGRSLIGRHLSELIGGFYPLNLPHIEAVLRGEPQQFEREIPDPDGGPPRHVLTSYVPDLVDGVVRGFIVMITDVSAIKRGELALRESEERFRLVVDEAPIGMALVALDGRFVRVNRALCELVGYSAEELTGLTFQAITHPADLDADLALAEKLARGEIPRYQLEKRYVRKDGSIVDVQLTGAALRGPDGAARYFIAQMEDVTEQTRAREALRQSQERFELALDGADLASWDWNVETGAAVFNARWAEMRGFRPDEVTASVDTWLAGVHPDDLPRVQRAVADHFEGRTACYDNEHRVRTRDGRWLWILDRGKVFSRGADGRPLRMVGTELDITERRRAQDEQQFLAEVTTLLAGSLELEQTLAGIARLAVQRLADCVIVDLVDEDPKLRRLLAVHADPRKAELCSELERLRLDPTRGHLAASLFEKREPVLVAEIGPAYLEAVAQGEEHLRLLRALDPRSMMAVPLLGRERLLGAVLFVSSSAARRFDERDLALAGELAQRAALAIENAQLYQTARRATQLRDDVLAIVAHDLRSPLSGILIQARMLRRRGDEPERRSRKPADNIELAARRMNRLIQDLLDVSRMEAGRLSVDPRPLSPRRLLADAIEPQQAAAAASSVELEVEHDGAANLADVWADRDRLLQVFENLIGNAVKFTPQGGRITVGAAPGDGEVLFWVSDTGTGIPADDVPRVFDRFWQAHKAARHGAGLGLPIVKGIVEAHGGRIWVESKPGLGTTFFFTVPLAPFTAAGFLPAGAPRSAGTPPAR